VNVETIRRKCSRIQVECPFDSAHISHSKNSCMRRQVLLQRSERRTKIANQSCSRTDGREYHHKLLDVTAGKFLYRVEDSLPRYFDCSTFDSRPMVAQTIMTNKSALSICMVIERVSEICQFQKQTLNRLIVNESVER
jgi:hypothetical protein